MDGMLTQLGAVDNGECWASFVYFVRGSHNRQLHCDNS